MPITPPGFSIRIACAKVSLCASGDDDAVYALAVGFLHDLLNDVALTVVDDIRRAEFQGELGAVFTRSHGVDIGRAANGRSGDGP